MKALIFAAGKGTRLKPFTDHHPKALALVNGIPLLERNIKYLQSYGINDFVINIHHFGSQIVEFLKKNGNFYVMDVSKYFLWPLSLFFGESAFTKNEFIKILEDNGLEVEKSSRSFFFFIAAKKL